MRQRLLILMAAAVVFAPGWTRPGVFDEGAHQSRSALGGRVLAPGEGAIGEARTTSVAEDGRGGQREARPRTPLAAWGGVFFFACAWTCWRSLSSEASKRSKRRSLGAFLERAPPTFQPA